MDFMGYRVGNSPRYTSELMVIDDSQFVWPLPVGDSIIIVSTSQWHMTSKSEHNINSKITLFVGYAFTAQPISMKFAMEIL